jgi:hypothetical protein
MAQGGECILHTIQGTSKNSDGVASVWVGVKAFNASGFLVAIKKPPKSKLGQGFDGDA